MRTRGFRRAATGLAVIAVGIGVAGTLAAASSARSVEVPGVQIKPALSGIAVGTTLTVSQGTWASMTPVAYSVQWIRAVTASRWEPIAGATGTSYTLAGADVGAQVFAQVKAVNSTGPQWSNTEWTPVVVDPTLAGATRLPSGALSVQATTVALPNRLVIASVSPTPTAVARNGSVSVNVRVTDSRGNPVAGATVALTPVPFGVAAAVPQQATAADGTVTLQVGPLRPGLLPQGSRLGLYVAVHKPGETAIAGVGTSRLISVRTGAA